MTEITCGGVMQRRWWRSWLFLTLIAAVFAVLAVHLFVERFTREEPNYSRIEDGLFMGGKVDAPPRGTTVVLNLCESEDRYQARVHRWQPIHDAEPAPSLDWLREQVEFIDTQRREGATVYVHCHAGMSRSGLVVAAYLMLKNGWGRDEALAFLRTKRPVVQPNAAFLALLLEWERVVKEREQ
jgi:Dual specificity phosphatase, catalytic domain